MTNFKFSTPTEALADAWASIEGDLEKFRIGSNALSDSYMAQAKELRRRLRARGFLITKLNRPRQPSK